MGVEHPTVDAPDAHVRDGPPRRGRATAQLAGAVIPALAGWKARSILRSPVNETTCGGPALDPPHWD